ncbi:MAG: glycosyltransferase [Candidatus Zambryskibacteria bacterium]|nr:glycosyltransferase [Candidatus Zambryskibacteria bacterium]
MIQVLSIGTDRKMFEEKSAVSLRAMLYGKKAGHMSVIVFSLASLGLSKKVLSPEVTVYPTNSSSRLGYVFDAIRIGKEIIKNEKFVRGQSVVTCQDPFECGLVGWRISRYFRLPLHLQLHTDFLSPYFKTSFLQTLRVILGRFLLPRASGVRVVSKHIAESLVRNNIHLKHNPDVLPIRVSIKPDEVQKIPDFFPQFNFVILVASRLEKEKRIQDAINAFASVVKQFPKAGLLIAGSGSQESALKSQVSSLGLSSSVVFLGWVESVASYIKSADVFLSTSEYEGYGMSVVEAGLLGTPVVTTKVGLAGEILIDKVNSFVCPVGDTLCITRSLVELIAHNEKRNILSQALQSDVRKTIPTEESYVDAFVHSFQKTLQ